MKKTITCIKPETWYTVSTDVATGLHKDGTLDYTRRILMPEKTWETTDQQIADSKWGIELQAEAHGIPKEVLESPEFKSFVDHTAKVQATALAGQNFYASKLHPK